MPPSMNLRVVIACVSFETVKIVKPVQFYRADRVILLHKGVKPPYDAFLKEVERQLDELGISRDLVKLDIYKFIPVLKCVLKLIRDEKARGNHVYVNVGAGPQMFCAASVIACMMEGAQPFNVGTKVFQVDDPKIYFESDHPVGMAKDVYDPFPLPEFEIKAPRQELVDGFGVWCKIHDRGGLKTTGNIIHKLAEAGLMDKISDKADRITQGAVMKFRRNFLDQWVKNGWIKKSSKGAYTPTEKGKGVLEIFGG